ncbi:MAG: hypothetical protein ABIH72_00395 [archaeon]
MNYQSNGKLEEAQAPKFDYTISFLSGNNSASNGVNYHKILERFEDAVVVRRGDDITKIFFTHNGNIGTKKLLKQLKRLRVLSITSQSVDYED